MKLIQKYRNAPIGIRIKAATLLAFFALIIVAGILTVRVTKSAQLNAAEEEMSTSIDELTLMLRMVNKDNLSRFRPVLHGKELLSGGYISFVNSKGEVLISPQGEETSVYGENFFDEVLYYQQGRTLREINNPDGVSSLEYIYFKYQPHLDGYLIGFINHFELITKPVYSNLLGIIALLMIVAGVIITVLSLSLKTVTPHLKRLQERAKELSNGILTEPIDPQHHDEIGQITKSVNRIQHGLKQSVGLINELETRNYSHQHTTLSNEDELGGALESLRKSLRIATKEADEQKRRNEQQAWTNKGLALFTDVLRKQTENVNDISYDVILNLVKYTDSNQGGIFFLNDEDKNDLYLEQVACYAYNRLKFLEKKIPIKSGLIGACFQEKAPIHLTDIPDNYIQITSGLGNSNPTSLLLMPIMIDEKVFGVIELASFNLYNEHELELTRKVGELYASNISRVKTTLQTNKLLEITQSNAEELKAQEEELMQNIEELQATQEESDRKNSELERLVKLQQQKEAELEAKETELEEIIKKMKKTQEAMLLKEEQLKRVAIEMDTAQKKLRANITRVSSKINFDSQPAADPSITSRQ